MGTWNHVHEESRERVLNLTLRWQGTGVHTRPAHWCPIPLDGVSVTVWPRLSPRRTVSVLFYSSPHWFYRPLRTTLTMRTDSLSEDSALSFVRLHVDSCSQLGNLATWGSPGRIQIRRRRRRPTHIG
jgi:hypothetical protein